MLAPIRLALASLLLAVAVVSALRAEERETLGDFEQPGLADRFVAVRQIKLAREPIAAMAPAGGPAGQALSASTDGGAGVVTKAGALKGNLLNASDVELWVHRSAAEKERGASIVEIQFIEADGRTRFWRKVELSHAGWQKVSLPLRWFQWGEGRIPRWDRVDRWGVWFRDKAELQIDGVTLVRQDDPDIALPQPEDLRQLAFPEIDAKEVRVVVRGDVLLATDAPALDVDKLAAHLAEVKKQVSADFSLPAAPPWPVPMIVFKTREEFQAFPPRLAARLNGMAAGPRSTGFTIQGMATSFWDGSFGTLRPVYTHEFVHGLLSRELGLTNKGEWFQEGAAVIYQMEFHPQANFPQIVSEGLANPNLRLPLADLANGKPIPQDRYWQAATLVELLRSDKKYQPKFAALLKAFSASGSTDLGPQLEKVLQVDWDELTADWRKYCQERYKVEK